MNNVTHKLTIDVRAAQMHRSVKVKKGDTARQLQINLCEGTKPYSIPDDCNASFSALKPPTTDYPEGVPIYNRCTIEDDAIVYQFTANTVDTVGEIECEVTLYDERGKRLTTANFTLIVEDRVYDGGTNVPAIELTELEEALKDAVAAKNNFLAVAGNVANAFKQISDVSSGGALSIKDLMVISGATPKIKIKAEKNATVYYCGNNLFNFSLEENNQAISVSNNEDGSITIQGSNTSNREIARQISDKILLHKGKYTFTQNNYLRASVSEGGSNTFKRVEGPTFEIKEDYGEIYFYARIPGGNENVNATLFLMFNEGDEAGDFEKPDRKTATIPETGEKEITGSAPYMYVYVRRYGGVSPFTCEYNKDSNAVYEELKGNVNGGGTVVDSQLSETSTNPVQNKVVTAAINNVNVTIGNIDALLETI